MYKSFREMPVWIESINLADQVYNIIDTFPKEEQYALSDQLRRSSVSVSANIAESFGRHHTLDKIKFYYNSRGSLCETESLLYFALKRSYISTDDFNKVKKLSDKILLDINLIIKSLRDNMKS
jgi:four helix bundle protein